MSVPALRFKEFNEEWSVKRLTDVAERIGDGLHSTPVYDKNGQYYFVNGNNLTNNKIEISENTKRVNADEYLKHKIELTTQTVLISINGTIGNLAFFNNEKVVLGKSACYINLKKSENKHFVFNLLQTSNITSHFDKELTGSTIKNLSLTTIKNTKAFFPSYQEQTKIANFLTAVDEKITQLTQEHDLLTQYKKGVMQQIFSQHLRFKNDDGQDFSEWTHDSLESYSETIQSGKSKSRKDIGKYIVYGSTGAIGFSNEFEYQGKNILIARVGANAGYLYEVNGSYGVSDNTLILALKKPNNHSFFLNLLTYANLNKLVFGSGQPLITGGLLKSLSVMIPCVDEQTKIANFLTAIDDKITVAQTQLQATKNYKQGLLQQMFI